MLHSRSDFYLFILLITWSLFRTNWCSNQICDNFIYVLVELMVVNFFDS